MDGIVQNSEKGVGWGGGCGARTDGHQTTTLMNIALRERVHGEGRTWRGWRRRLGRRWSQRGIPH